jgi:hypothetical protein
MHCGTSLSFFANWFAELALVSRVIGLLFRGLASVLRSAMLRCLELEVCCLHFASLLEGRLCWLMFRCTCLHLLARLAKLALKLRFLLLCQRDLSVLVLLLETHGDVVAAVLDVSLPRLLQIDLVLLQVHGEALELSVGTHVRLTCHVANL